LGKAAIVIPATNPGKTKDLGKLGGSSMTRQVEGLARKKTGGLHGKKNLGKRGKKKRPISK